MLTKFLVVLMSIGVGFCIMKLHDASIKSFLGRAEELAEEDDDFGVRLNGVLTLVVVLFVLFLIGYGLLSLLV